MKGVVRWFAENTVAANLLMVILIAGGMVTLLTVKQEIFPELSPDLITINVVYPGAAPAEVEEAVCVRIEEALQGIEGVKRITSTATENVGAVSVELFPYADAKEVLDEVKSRVDAIDTFPEDAEQPVVKEPSLTPQVVSLAIYGNVDERTLKRLGERVRDQLTARPEITVVSLASVRPYEISIEVSESVLRQYQLTFDEVVAAVRRGSVDLPGGSVKTAGGEILIRTRNQAYTGADFERLVLRTLDDGTRLELGRVAEIVDGFEDVDLETRFDGKPAIIVHAFRVGEQGAIEVAQSVTEYVEEAAVWLPDGIEIAAYGDASKMLESRIDLLLRNGLVGLALVFLVLALFMELKLALWVSFGILVSFLGAIWCMPVVDVSINLISLFAFILVLGIVVDDAIVVGENIYRRREGGLGTLRAAIEGTQQVSTPVLFAVFTSMAAFAPLLLVEGRIGKIMRVVPLIVIPCLLFSLVESQMILPAHLGHELRADSRLGRVLRAITSLWEPVQRWFARRLDGFIRRAYQPSLDFALRWRYLVVASAFLLGALTVGFVGGGYIDRIFFPKIESDNVGAMLTMPTGVPTATTAAVVQRLERSAQQVIAELEAEGHGGVVRHMLASVGEQPYRSAQSSGGGRPAQQFLGSHMGEVTLELAPSEDRPISSERIAQRWRDATGPIADVVELNFTSSLFDPGDAIDVQLAGPELDDLQAAAKELKRKLAGISGVYDISDSFRAGKQELKLGILPSAEVLGLTMSDLARQVRQGFYGAEAQRVQRGRDDVKVMVRYPERERRALGDLENMRVRVPGGGAGVPLSSVATIEVGVGFANIKRSDRQRTVNITADVDTTKGNANDITADLEGEILPAVLQRYPNITFRFSGQQEEQAETLGGLARGGVIAMLIIYALLAIPFKSYAQPLMVMSAIPFGLIGAVWGHVLMGLDVTILSMFGIVALAGVVVNDNLVMVDFINRTREGGESLEAAVRLAGAKRFRPIVLTSLTTFAGLTPLLLEKSVQAQFLVPMGVSLGFGVLFATSISLMLVPSLYLILEDLKRVMGFAADRS